MQWLHIGRKDLTAFCDVYRRGVDTTVEVFTHGALVATVAYLAALKKGVVAEIVRVLDCSRTLKMTDKGYVRDVLCLGVGGANGVKGVDAKRCKAGNWIYCL
jgi:hypothetical protein